jgi:hypothetical protein
MNILAFILVGTIAFSLCSTYPMISIAQEEEEETGGQLPGKMDIPLNFTLKAQGGDDEKLNATEAKEVIVTLSVHGAKDGSPMQIPVTAKVGNDTQTQDVELCTTLGGAEEMCNSLDEIMQAVDENQTNGNPSNQSSSSGNATENDEDDDEDN